MGICGKNVGKQQASEEKPGSDKALRPQKIKRRLKHANGQLYATQYPATMNMSRASVDILDQEMNLFELKQMLKISKDCVRKNYFKHMHGAPKPAPNEQTPNGYN